MFKLFDWQNASQDARLDILRRPERSTAAAGVAAQIVERIASEGAPAVRHYVEKFDGFAPTSFRVPTDAIRAAGAALDAEDAEAIRAASDAIRRFHVEQGYRQYALETWPGVTATRRAMPIDTAGLYVPAGSASLVSTLMMLAIPAQLAGVGRIVVAAPPANAQGMDPVLLAGASLLGIDEIYAIGGAQAIAAMAFGVAGLPRADKIFGPGNAYVAAAKSCVANRSDGCAVDLPAGPSEVMVVADRDADAELVASDLLSQAEHDPLAHILLICFDRETRDAIAYCVEKLLTDLPRETIARQALKSSAAIICKDREQVLEVINLYAPEHVILQVCNADTYVSQIRNAGSVFVGPWAPEASGDYAAGPNHTLPTGGAARAFGGVGVESFQKTVTVLNSTARGALAIAKTVERLASLEGLDGHRSAMALRRRKAEQLANDAPQIRQRASAKRRQTGETDIVVTVNLDQFSVGRIDTGIGYFDHMLEQIARHARIALSVSAKGDLHIDAHHTIEDVCLVLGDAIRDALGEKRGLQRFGFELPMDEARAGVWIDLSGRPYSVFEGSIPGQLVGGFPVEMTAHAFRSLAESLRAAIHVSVRGDNAHHMIEACFKAFGRALGQAVKVDGDTVPSSKEFVA
jgi:histidinol dehydrogenase